MQKLLSKTSKFLFFTGKGGGGKTALASKMAARGAKVHLTAGDPAAHLDVSLAKQRLNLRVSRIDPAVGRIP